MRGEYAWLARSTIPPTEIQTAADVALMRQDQADPKKTEVETERTVEEEREVPKPDDDTSIRFLSWDLPLVSG